MSQKKLLTFSSDEVVEELNKLDNMSAFAEAAVAKALGITFDGDSVESQKRQDILAGLDTPIGLVRPITETVTAARIISAEPELSEEGKRYFAEIDTEPTAEELLANAETELLESEYSKGEINEEPSLDASDTTEDLLNEEAEVPAAEGTEPTDSDSQEAGDDIEIPVFALGQPVNQAAANKPQPVQSDYPHYNAGSLVDPVSGQTLCPTCREVKATDICLNCL